MNILFIGRKNQQDEFLKCKNEYLSISFTDLVSSEINFNEYDYIIHAYADELNEFSWIENVEQPIVLCSIKKQLNKMSGRKKIAGINFLPTFIQRDVLEMSFNNPEDEEHFTPLANALSKKILRVKDEVGMVTPAVITMIINEASFLLMEQTASVTDIDAAMKLGTAYPFGPFEWANKIGLKNVVDVLVAMKENSGEARYELCPLLQQMVAERKTFLLQQ